VLPPVQPHETDEPATAALGGGQLVRAIRAASSVLFFHDSLR
jgi:hypothetical protein